MAIGSSSPRMYPVYGLLSTVPPAICALVVGAVGQLGGGSAVQMQFEPFDEVHDPAAFVSTVNVKVLVSCVPCKPGASMICPPFVPPAGVATHQLIAQLPAGKPVAEGFAEGRLLGEPVGDALGEPVGDAVGEPVGDDVGEPVGEPVGDVLGEPVCEKSTRLMSRQNSVPLPLQFAVIVSC